MEFKKPNGTKNINKIGFMSMAPALDNKQKLKELE